ncbi:MAG: hypothetical protein U5J64_00540 [Halobacteriales archaeon]|nr:hypothetical protein [Halobacteriales archaeon]
MKLKLPIAAFVIGVAVSIAVGIITGRELTESVVSGVAVGTGLAIGFYFFADRGD